MSQGVDLNAAAEQIRRAIEVYRALDAVAAMLDSLDPLDEAHSVLTARVAETQRELEVLAKQKAAEQGRVEALRREYENSMRMLARDLEVREREFEAELQARHAERLAALAAINAEIKAKEEHHRAVTEQVERLRRLFT
jgi:SMC interacting uncharacterized protein involved in chromosome segregation